MGLELNNGDSRTYTKIVSVTHSEGVATIVTLNKHNSLETPVTDDVFTFNTDTKPTVEEAYNLIKILPEFEGFYDC